MAERGTIWNQLEECVAQLDQPFRASEIVGWFRRHAPDINEASLRAHIQSATSNVSASSKIAGFSGRRPLITRVSHGLYVRYEAAGESIDHPREMLSRSDEAPDLILIACSNSKTLDAQPARDLYLGGLFRKAKSYSESQGCRWYVLSGKWGLLSPQEVIAPYDLYLGDQSAAYRRAWGEWVAAQLELVEGSLRDRVVEIHAGQTYLDPLSARLRRLGAVVREPLRGLRQGEQLAWYGSPQRPRAPSGRDYVSLAAEPLQTSATPGNGWRVLWGPIERGAFAYRWPEETEQFDASWEVGIEDGGKAYIVRHCLGGRHVYERWRRHSVTFINRVPEVEGVAADDYQLTGGLLSPVKGADGKLVRHFADVPERYRAFTVVDNLLEINAKYSRSAVAVKLAEDDVEGWAGYALARQAVRLGATNQRGAEHGTEPAVPTIPTVAPGTGIREDVIGALLALGRSGLDNEWVGSASFTPNPAANQLIVNDGFAFLLGVLFDHGIQAERAWQAPYELSLRLGHLDPGRMATEGEAIRTAIATRPMLHRFINLVPGWVVAAAQLVLREYGGDASAIWQGQPTAREVQKRLMEFPGIAQKKAAMAVEILERDLGVPIRDMHGSDVAYDVHVRRVFLRTGLAQVDDLDHMVEIARAANPDRPGEIDLPAWHVGRTWCRAGVPDCGSCPLAGVCPKDIDAASKVRGA